MEILTLHYLIHCESMRISGDDESFSMNPAGLVYEKAFDDRVIRRIVATFGRRRGSLLEAARVLGGEGMRAGDEGVRLFPFPKAPVKIILWHGDDEIAANASFLFDRCTVEALPAEDLAVLAEDAVDRLVLTAGPSRDR